MLTRGKGVFSAQAALIAEELDIELDQVDDELRYPGSSAYFNTAVTEAMVRLPDV